MTDVEPCGAVFLKESVNVLDLLIETLSCQHLVKDVASTENITLLIEILSQKDLRGGIERSVLGHTLKDASIRPSSRAKVSNF
jgi:hypothetical protein